MPLLEILQNYETLETVFSEYFLLTAALFLHLLITFGKLKKRQVRITANALMFIFLFLNAIFLKEKQINSLSGELTINGILKISSVFFASMYLIISAVFHSKTAEFKIKSPYYCVVFVILHALLQGVTTMNLMTWGIYLTFIVICLTDIYKYISAPKVKIVHDIRLANQLSISLILFFLGMLLVYVMTGSLNLQEIIEKMAKENIQSLQIGLLLIIVSLSIIAGIMPGMRGINKYIESNHDLLTSTFVSVVRPLIVLSMCKIGTVLLQLEPETSKSPPLIRFISALGIFIFITSVFKLFRIRNWRSFLDHLSIMAVGYHLVFFEFMSHSLTWIYQFWLNQITSSLLLLGMCGCFSSAHFEHLETKLTSIEKLKGFANEQPILSYSFVLFIYFLVGFPPTPIYANIIDAIDYFLKGERILEIFLFSVGWGCLIFLFFKLITTIVTEKKDKPGLRIDFGQQPLVVFLAVIFLIHQVVQSQSTLNFIIRVALIK